MQHARRLVAHGALAVGAALVVQVSVLLVPYLGCGHPRGKWGSAGERSALVVQVSVLLVPYLGCGHQPTRERGRGAF